MVGPMRKSLLSKAVTAVCATVMCLGVTACGGNSSAKSDKSNSDSSSSSEKIGMHQIAGVTAKGKLGEKPTISFNTPMTVSDGSYVVLQKGDGDVIEEGDRVMVCLSGGKDSYGMLDILMNLQKKRKISEMPSNVIFTLIYIRELSSRIFL
mgnify:CR=1 FL=1